MRTELRTDSFHTPFPTVEQLPVIDVAAVDPARAATVDRVSRRAREDGHAAGYADGYERGRSEAHAEAAREVALAMKALHGGVDALAVRDAAGLAELTTTAIDLAMAIAEAVLQRELAASTTAGRDALVRALAVAPRRGVIDAHLHPSDLATVGSLDGLVPGGELQLVADDTVERGGCVLHIGATHIDAQLGPALARVRAELMGDEEQP